MTTLIQMNRDDLQDALKAVLLETINEIRRLPSQPEPPENMTIDEAVEFCRESGRPITKSKIYRDSMLGTIPVEKFGKRLVFSRSELQDWLEEQTISKTKARGIAADQLSSEAIRKL